MRQAQETQQQLQTSPAHTLLTTGMRASAHACACAGAGGAQGEQQPGARDGPKPGQARQRSHALAGAGRPAVPEAEPKVILACSGQPDHWVMINHGAGRRPGRMALRVR